MRISKEFLLEAVGLSLLVTLIFVSMQLFQRAMRITSLMEDRQTQQITELEEYEIVKYDNLLLDGMTAINYIKRITETYGIPVYVSTSQCDFVIVEKSEHADLRNAESGKYMSPFKKFRCMVERDENGVITKIQMKEGE